MAAIQLSRTIVFDGVTYTKVEIPEYLEVGHQDFYLENKEKFSKDRLGIVLCAHMCEVPFDAFKKFPGDDFKKISVAISKLFPDADEKDQKKSNRLKRG